MELTCVSLIYLYLSVHSEHSTNTIDITGVGKNNPTILFHRFPNDFFLLPDKFVPSFLKCLCFLNASDGLIWGAGGTCVHTCMCVLVKARDPDPISISQKLVV